MAGKETENILQSDQKNLKLKSHGQVRLILKSEIESRHENQQHINCEECKSYKSSSSNESVVWCTRNEHAKNVSSHFFMKTKD